MHKACVYLSYYGAVTFFLQMEPVRQEEGAHVKQNTTHAMQREKQHASNAIQCNAMLSICNTTIVSNLILQNIGS